MRRKFDRRESEDGKELLQVRIPRSLKERFRRSVEFQGINLGMSTVLRQLIEKHVKEFEKTGVIKL